MIKTIIAYILTLILGPLIGGFAQLILMPITLPLIKLGLHKFFIAFLSGTASGFTATWIGTKIFFWLDKEPGFLMLVFLAISFLQNDIRRLSTRKDGEMETGYLVGDIAGIILGGYFLIYN